MSKAIAGAERKTIMNKKYTVLSILGIISLLVLLNPSAEKNSLTHLEDKQKYFTNLTNNVPSQREQIYGPPNINIKETQTEKRNILISEKNKELEQNSNIIRKNNIRIVGDAALAQFYIPNRQIIANNYKQKEKTLTPDLIQSSLETISLPENENSNIPPLIENFIDEYASLENSSGEEIIESMVQKAPIPMPPIERNSNIKIAHSNKKANNKARKQNSNGQNSDFEHLYPVSFYDLVAQRENKIPLVQIVRQSENENHYYLPSDEYPPVRGTGIRLDLVR